MIYREERIGKKTFERYKGREDKLIYRSVTFNPDWTEKKPTDLSIADNHHVGNKHRGEAVIYKMTQKFSMGTDLPAE